LRRGVDAHRLHLLPRDRVALRRHRLLADRRTLLREEELGLAGLVEGLRAFSALVLERAFLLPLALVLAGGGLLRARSRARRCGGWGGRGAAGVGVGLGFGGGVGRPTAWLEPAGVSFRGGPSFRTGSAGAQARPTARRTTATTDRRPAKPRSIGATSLVAAAG